MVKFFSDDYFKEIEERLGADAQWQQDMKAVKSTILINVTDQGAIFLLKVENGSTTISRSATGVGAEFSFEGPYEVWTRVGRGELDFQSAVLKGLLKFRGSITKILFYKDRFNRISDVIKSIPVEA